MRWSPAARGVIIIRRSPIGVSFSTSSERRPCCDGTSMRALSVLASITRCETSFMIGKNLDLVLCTRSGPSREDTLARIAPSYNIQLSPQEKADFDSLPALVRAPVGSVLLALEAKACMTAHQRALPRLYDELNSSHVTVHGSSDQAIAVGFSMVNAAKDYLSPDLNKKNKSSDPGMERASTAA
jgi:hypothetical protein